MVELPIEGWSPDEEGNSYIGIVIRSHLNRQIMGTIAKRIDLQILVIYLLLQVADDVTVVVAARDGCRRAQDQPDNRW